MKLKQICRIGEYEILLNEEQKTFAFEFSEAYPETWAEIVSAAYETAKDRKKNIVISFFCRHTHSGTAEFITDDKNIDPIKLQWKGTNGNVALSPLSENDEELEGFESYEEPEIVANYHIILASGK